MYIIRETSYGIIAGKLLDTYKEGKFIYYRISVIYNSEYDSDTRIYHILKIGNISIYDNEKDFWNNLKLLLL